jgi:hypothetical protein
VVRSRNFIPRSKLETERGGERWTLGKRRRKCVCLCVWWCVCVCVCERERERERECECECVCLCRRESERVGGERERERDGVWVAVEIPSKYLDGRNVKRVLNVRNRLHWRFRWKCQSVFLGSRRKKSLPAPGPAFTNLS